MAKKKRDTAFYDWVEGVLVNDEYSSDKEMESHFKKVGKMTKKESVCYVKQRDSALQTPLGFKLKKCSIR